MVVSPSKDSLAEIAEKVESGERLTREDGIALLNSTDLLKIGQLADLVRERKVGEDVYFIVNQHIYYTNVCLWQCPFCAFSRTVDSPEAYTKSLEEIEEEALEAIQSEPGLSELRITGGIHLRLSLEYFEEMLVRLKKILPEVHLEAFAPTEIDYIASQAGLSIEQVLNRFKALGLGALCAGGAEIFSPRVRQKLCPQKSSGQRWLEIMRIAHSLGIPSNASLLYGHIETVEERIEHLIQLRELQDETGGFNAFIPLPFLSENEPSASGYDDLKMLAVARLMLDNFDHIKVLWIYQGLKMGQIALSFGANDLGGTVREQRKGVARSAGSGTGEAVSKEELVGVIRDAGRIPVERGILYERKN